MRARYLVEVDDRLPVVVLQLVEMPHPDLAKVSRMILVDVGSVVVLSSSHTASTRVLAVLANASVAGRNMASTVRESTSAEVLV